MGVSCRIYIKKPREGIHRAGKPVIGILSYAIDQPTEYQTATLSLIGKAKCQWTMHSGKTTHTYTGHETFLSLRLNILDKRPEETVTLPVGAYEFQFQFTLPFEIPPSFQDKHSDIEYHLVARFEKPSFFSWARKFEKKLTVYGNVNPTVPMEPVSYGIRKVLFKLFSSKEHVVDIKAQITKSFLMPGENAELQLIVTNDTDTNIKYVSTELISRTSYHSTGFFGTDTKIEEKTYHPCMVMTPSVPQNKISKFTCLVPTLPELYSIQHCKIIKKDYFLRLTASLSFPHINPSVNIPIVIGEGRFGDCSGVIELDNIDEANEAAPNIMDSPPSYWEVMNEDNSEEKSDEKN
ncbi:arrestin domain-containing protein 2-like [Choristoneura fumiferana]|uniref:arrestin domain-containing protein 2-like n=1 Tax=Choristoneura fumiferana TaxID=7141 RepID=UPI003D15E666